ncbi:MAG TPA: hypothetical protein VFC67_28100 [Prolixibacteraceae bacterium]|nr:hypothetical protein [Prolixibacteraceae bacterium]
MLRLLYSNPMTKEIWRQSWLESINKLTSYALQKNCWKTFPSGSYQWSFVDFVNYYFKDVLFGFDYQFYAGAKYITQKEYEIIIDWHTELNNYIPPNGNDFDNLAIFSDRKWLSILFKGMFAKQTLISAIPEYEKEFLEEITLPWLSPRWNQ